MLPSGYTLSWVSGPDPELLLLSEAKDHLRVKSDAEIQLVQQKLRAARIAVESEIGKPVGRQVFETKLTAWPALLVFPRLPFIELVSIYYTKEDGTVVAFYDPAASPPVDPATFTVQSGGDFRFGELHFDPLETWPTATLARGWPITIRFTAGIESLPPNLRDAWLLKLELLYDRNVLNAELLDRAFRALCSPSAIETIT